MEPLKILGLSIGAAVVYGLVHDQITAHLCVEYFSVGHPPLFGTDDPTLLGLGWGVVATWWAGLMLGVPLAVAARWGTRPKVTARQLARPVMQLLIVMGVLAAIAGSAAWVLGRQGLIPFEDAQYFGLPPERWVAFTTDLWIHSASYLVGFVGGVVVIVRVWRGRGVLASELAAT